MKKKWKLYSACLAVFAMLLFGGIAVSAEGSNVVQVTGSFNQTEARKLLQLINDFRTGSDAWCWDKNDSQKVYDNTLQPVAYDYGLEQSAMQRAIESAISFLHTRPNGEEFRDVDSAHVAGENCATGSSAESVFRLWQNVDKTYSGQVSRRNMLNKSVKTIGAGCVTLNGKTYWALVFGFKSTGVSDTGSVDGEKMMEVEVASDRVAASEKMKISASSLTVPFGSEAALPTVKGSIKAVSAYPDVLTPVSVKCDWKAASGGGKYISISDGSVTGKACGKTSVTADVFGETFKVSVTVSQKKITSKSVSLATSTYTYNGKARKPAVTVVVDGKTLTKGTDYTVKYTNNTKPGTAKAQITGKGNYKGTVSKSFKIKEAKKIAAGTQGQVNGTKYKVTKGGISGAAEVQYVAPVNAAKASVTIPATVTLKGFKCKVTSIAANAFKNNAKLKNVEIPASVGKIGKQAFYNCQNLKKAVIKSKTLTAKTVGANAFGKLPANVTLKVPASKVNDYREIFKAKGLGQNTGAVK